MRIALISPGFPEYAAQLASAIADRHEALLVLERQQFRNEMGVDPEAYDWPARLKLKVIDHRPQIRASLGNALTVACAVGQFRPDVVHLQENLRDYAFLASQALRAYPLVLTVHDPTPHSGADTDRMYERYGRYLRSYRRRAARAVVHGDMLAQDLIRQQPHLAGRTSVIPHAVLGTGDGPEPVQPPGSRKVLLFGRMEEYKGVEDFVEVIRRVPDPRVKGVLAGRGPALDRLLPLEPERFEVHNDFVDRATVLRLFDEADFVFLPYRDATQSGVALLAVGRHRPVVSTEVGALSEVVRQGVNGLLVPPRDLDVQVSAVTRLLEDRHLLGRLSAGAAGLADSELGWTHAAQLTVNVYGELVDGRSDTATRRG